MDELKRELTKHPPLMPGRFPVYAGAAGEFIHWELRQDIMDTGLVLQIMESLELVELVQRSKQTPAMAEHKNTVMAGGPTVNMLPITFGYKVAVWQKEITRHLTRLEQVRSVS